MNSSTIDLTNNTIGQNCVDIVPGFLSGVIEDDQTLTVELEDFLMSMEVDFPSGQTATVEVLERESKHILWS